MKQRAGQIASTRNPQARQARILKAAGEVFARSGFAAGCVREISVRARVNVASIHYYFGSKQGLYQELLRQEHRRLREAEPMPDASGPPAEAVRRWVRFCLRLILLQRRAHSALGRLIAHEMPQPSPALEMLVRDMIRPMFTPLVEAVECFAEGRLTREQVELAAHLIVAMCVHFDHSRAVIARLGLVVPEDEAGIEQLAERVGNMAVGGLHELVRNAAAPGAVPQP